MSLLIQKFIPVMTLLMAAVIGYVSYSAFLVFLYTGSLDWIRLSAGEPERMMLNAMLCFAFFVQHSGMIRRPFRRRLARIIPTHYLGVAYTVASGVMLLFFVVCWQGSETTLLEADGVLRHLMRGLYFLSLLGIVWGLLALRSVDMFGLSPVLKRSSAAPIKADHLTIRGPYRWVRHPLYLFMIVLFWSDPILTTDRLLFNTLWTIWVVSATVLEERDLANDFGAAYRDYQAKVPMLVPKGFRPAYLSKYPGPDIR